MANSNSCKYVVCFVCCMSLIKADLNEGDTCKVTFTGHGGVCKLLHDCPVALHELRYQARLPTSCGYKSHTQFICCPIIVSINEPDKLVVKKSKVVQKCLEYGQYVYQNYSLLFYDTKPTPTSKTTDRCGHISKPFIIGGTPATAREFPHSALLGFRQSDGDTISWDCGGSLVSSRYVLTAGHCLTSPNGDVAKVRLGELVLGVKKYEGEEIDINVEKIIPHPDYLNTLTYNDIALLKLAHKIELSPFIRPICLPTVDEQPAKVIATGWGSIEQSGPNSTALLKVELETYTNKECNKRFEFNLVRQIRNGIIEKQMCAGSPEKKDTCQGDSGGPIQIFNTDVYCTYKQLGITSFGVGCGHANFPSVYTRVYNYVDWIESIIWAPGEDQ